MTAKIAKLILSLFFLVISVLHSNPSYKMQICDIEVLSSDKISACVYIENVGEEFVLTSYQCAFSINQEIDLASLTLEYIDGSSDLLNEPNLFVGIDNIDGSAELTFVSYIGNDIISSKKLVGKFTIEGNIDIEEINLLDIQWDFEGTISTILTGKNFVNITNPTSHLSIFSSQNNTDQISMLDIEDVSASNGSSSVIKVIDGLGYGDDEDSKWAQEGMPASLIFDLGNISSISKTRFSFYYFAEGRIYKYNVRVSPDGENWTEVLSEVYSKSEEWSEEEFAPIEARYLELEILSSSGPNSGNWATLWEAEIWGIGGINNIDNEDELAEEEDLIPSEFGISQNYPNPFNPSTKVEIMMKENGSARLDVYNLLGEKVIEVLNKDLIAGVHQINIDGSKLASGTYIYQLIINNKFALSKKMQLMK